VILFTLAFFAFGAADLIRWSPSPVSRRRSSAALAGAVLLTVALAVASNLDWAGVLVCGGVTIVVLVLWLALDRIGPGRRSLGQKWSLVLVGAVFTILFVFSGQVDNGFEPLSFE
jgi:hypothetical protein